MIHDRKKEPSNYQLIDCGEMKIAHQSSCLMMALRKNHFLIYSTIDRTATLYDSISQSIVTLLPYQFKSKDNQFHGQLSFDTKPLELPANRIVCHYIDYRKDTRKTVLFDFSKNISIELDNNRCVHYSYSRNRLACVSDDTIRFFDLSSLNEENQLPIKFSLSAPVENKKFSDVTWISHCEVSVLFQDGSIVFYSLNENNELILQPDSVPPSKSGSKDFHFCSAKSKKLFLSCSQVSPPVFFTNLADYAQALYCQIKIFSTKDKSCVDYIRINNFFKPTLLPNEKHVMSVSQDKNLKYKIAVFDLEKKLLHKMTPQFESGMTLKELCFLENGRIIARLKNKLDQDCFYIYAPGFVLLREEKLISDAVHKEIDGLFKMRRQDTNIFPKDIAKIVGEYAVGIRKNTT